MVGQLVRGQGIWTQSISAPRAGCSTPLRGCLGPTQRFCLFLNIILTECVSEPLNCSESPASPLCWRNRKWIVEFRNTFSSFDLTHRPALAPVGQIPNRVLIWCFQERREDLPSHVVYPAPESWRQPIAQRSHQKAWAAASELGKVQITRSWRPAQAPSGLQSSVTGSRQPWGPLGFPRPSDKPHWSANQLRKGVRPPAVGPWA